MDRDILFERFIENLELYLNYKRHVDEKSKELLGQGIYDLDSALYEEKNMLYNLRGLCRIAFDSYLSEQA